MGSPLFLGRTEDESLSRESQQAILLGVLCMDKGLTGNHVQG